MAAPPATTTDAFLGGRLRLSQPRHGHRIGTDAMLLAAAAPPARRVVDMGAGVGAVGLAMALRLPEAEVTLVERDAAIVALARHNVALNGLEARADVLEADVFDAAAFHRGLPGLEAVDLVVTNPPFADAGETRASPEPRRRAAHVLAGGTLDDWLRAVARVLAPGGALLLIHRADALPALLAACAGRFGGLAVRPVHATAGAAASRLLLAGRMGSKAPLVLLPPLVLHKENGRFTEEAAAIHSGELTVAMLAP
jgi:tRNA1(Val) A37 N6-methylase TrmN6